MIELLIFAKSTFPSYLALARLQYGMEDPEFSPFTVKSKANIEL